MGRQARYRGSDKKLASEATGELEKVCLKFKNFSLSLSHLKLKLAIETDLKCSLIKLQFDSLAFGHISFCHTHLVTGLFVTTTHLSQ